MRRCFGLRVFHIKPRLAHPVTVDRGVTCKDKNVEDKRKQERKVLPQLHVVCEDSQKLVFVEEELEEVLVLHNFDILLRYISQACDFRFDIGAVYDLLKSSFLLLWKVFAVGEDYKINHLKAIVPNYVDVRRYAMVEHHSLTEHLSFSLCFFFLYLLQLLRTIFVLDSLHRLLLYLECSLVHSFNNCEDK